MAALLAVSASPCAAQESATQESAVPNEPPRAEERAPTSNFHSVGFDVDTGDQEAFTQSVIALTKDCEPILLDADDIVCRQQLSSGGQIWIGLREAGESYDFITANPGFVGKSAFPVTVEGVEFDPDWAPFEYRLAVRFSDLTIPLLIALADPREAERFRDLEQPAALTLDLTAFTFNPEIFADEEAFLEAQKRLGDDITYAADFFIPTGLFGDETSARASFAGEILEAERITTGAGTSHWRTLVKVQGGGTVNVVFDDIWPDLDPKPGQLISGAFWLSAQVPQASAPAP